MELDGLAGLTVNVVRDITGRAIDVDGFVAAVLEGAPVPADEPLKKRLPDVVKATHLAGLGCYLLLEFEKLPKLAVLNVAHARMDAYIDVPEQGFLLAAGGRRVLLYLPKANTFQVYDVRTGQKLREGPSRLPVKPVALAMGALCEDKALALRPTEKRKDRYHARLMELKGFSLLPPAPKGLGWLSTVGPGGLYADARLRHFSCREGRFCIDRDAFVPLRTARWHQPGDNMLSVSPDGRWVCCAHGFVSDLPLPQEITAEVVRGGKRQTATFQHTRIVGVHPTADLALLQIVRPGPVRFLAVPPSTQPIRAGEKIYVIGIAAGAEAGRAEKSIEHGEVISPSTKTEDGTYALTSAVITARSSGGAVCDASGRVIGITAFGIGRKQEAGYFVPLSGYRQADLVSPERRPVNESSARRLAGLAREWARRARALRRTTRPGVWPCGSTGRP